MWDVVRLLSHGIATTAQITSLSFLVGAVLAVPLVLMRRSRFGLLRWISATLVEVARAVPPIAWLFITFYAVGSGAVTLSTLQAGVIGLGVIAAAQLSEVYRSGLSAVPSGQWDAVGALALPMVPVYTRVIFPQALPVIVPAMATYAIALLKDSATASVIGATDIAFLAVQQTQQDLKGLLNFGLAAILYFALGVPLAVAARLLGGRLRRQLETVA